MRRSRAGVVVGAALLVAASGCGGDPRVDATADADAAATAPPASDEAPSEPEAATPDHAADGAAGPGGYPVREDEEAAAAAGRPGPREPVKVTYQASGAGLDEAMTLVFDGDRFAVHFGGGRIIQTPTGTVLCGDGDDGCIEIPGDDRALSGFAGGMGGLLTIEDRISDESLPPSWTIVDPRSVAGRDATCAEFDAAEVTPDETGTMRYCYDEDLGIGLYWEGTVDGETQSFEATSVETPTDADFEPTGPVTSSGQ